MNELVGVRFQVDTSETEKNFKRLISTTNNLNNSMTYAITGVNTITEAFSKQNTKVRELESLYSLTGKELKKASEEWYLLSKETGVSSEKLEDHRKKINEASLAHQLMGEKLENNKNKLKELRKENLGVNESFKMQNIDLLNQKSFELARGFTHIGTSSKGTSADLLALKTNINILNGFVKTSENNIKYLTDEYSKLSQNTEIVNKDLEIHRKKITQATLNHNDMTNRLGYLNNKLRQTNNNINTLSNSANRNGNSFGILGAKMLGYVGAAVGIREIISLGKKSIDINSSMIETQDKFNIVYGEHSKEANKWAKNYSNVLGMSELKTKEAMGNIQNLFTGFGMDRKLSKDLSKDILMLSNDLDSFNNLSSKGIDVHKTMQSALMGESEAAKTLGAALTEKELNKTAETMGYKQYSSKMEETTKIMIRLRTIQNQSKDAIGNTVISLNTEVGKRRVLNNEVEKFQNMLGEKLMPLQLKYLDTGAETLKFLTNNADAIINVTQALGVMGSSYGVYKGVGAVIKGYAKATETLSKVQQGQTVVTNLLTLAQQGLSVAYRSNPIGFVLGGITAAIGVGYLLYKNWDTLKEKAYGLWSAMENNPFGRAAKFIIQYLTPVGQLTTGIQKLYEWYKKFKGEEDINKTTTVTGIIKTPVELDKTQATSTPTTKIVNSIIGEKQNQKKDGSHKTGLPYVPFDGYVAELHKGERVLTAEESKAYNSTINNNHSSTINNNKQKSQNKLILNIEKVIDHINVNGTQEIDYKSIASKVVEHIIPKLEIALAEV